MINLEATTQLPGAAGRPAPAKPTPAFQRLRTRLEELRTRWQSVLFLDIETTGLSRHYHTVTVVGFSLAGEYAGWVQGDDETALRAALARAQTVVTFNGSLFDLPFLRQHMTDLPLPTDHLDLRFACRHLGLKGGQKRIERELGIVRERDLDGAAAVLLWHAYVEGDDGALDELLAYNRDDVQGMARLLDHVIEGVCGRETLFAGVSFYDAQVRSSRYPARSPATARERGLRPLRYKDLFAGTPAEAAVIVGVDLTGSAVRPTGIATARGTEVWTARVGTDDEIMDYVRRHRPALVSIDSPLSIPTGRISVFDDDPGRDEFGILRQCERTLKRRGINVYPSLLLSMQRLTKRGMELAARLRGEGFATIESYPGAAQDIVGIARKGAGIEYLASGLRRFGYDGFEYEGISHDELDAITCTLVGTFFLDDRYEALGTETEAPLIIPLLERSTAITVIGVSGRIAAGKTTFARELERQGFGYVRYSEVVDDYIIAANEMPSRETRQRYGEHIHDQLGQRWLGRRLAERISPDRPWVVDGLRFLEDHAFWGETAGVGFTHVHIAASVDVRRERYESTTLTREEFAAIDQRAVEREIDTLGELAQIRIANEAGIDELLASAAALAAQPVARR
jgi:predicted nuclease with RNAse H fold